MFYIEGTKDRVIVFSTTKNFEILKNSTEWYCDGTFDVSPLLFKQVYTINVIMNGKNLPMVYALLPHKQETTYNIFFKYYKRRDSD